jgi:phosphatidylglycerol:prolipoprotein diacylglycerol transferase
MHPILFQIGGIPVFSYGVLVATGVLLALWYGRRRAARVGVDPDKLWSLGIYGVLASLLGAKLWLIATAWEYYSANPREIFSVTMFQSGGTFYGGVLGGIIGVILYAHFQKMPLLPVFDICSAAIPLGHSIGRLGCFMAGCCFGKPTDVAWGVTFTNPVAAQLAGTPLGIHLHPTQLYEAALEFLNFLFLVWLGKRQRFSGQIAGTYMILYGFERGILEFFRGDPGRTMMFHDSISLMQIVSIILIAGGSLLWWRGLNGSAPLGPAVASADAARS